MPAAASASTCSAANPAVHGAEDGLGRAVGVEHVARPRDPGADGRGLVVVARDRDDRAREQRMRGGADRLPGRHQRRHQRRRGARPRQQLRVEGLAGQVEPAGAAGQRPLADLVGAEPARHPLRDVEPAHRRPAGGQVRREPAVLGQRVLVGRRLAGAAGEARRSRCRGRAARPRRRRGRRARRWRARRASPWPSTRIPVSPMLGDPDAADGLARPPRRAPPRWRRRRSPATPSGPPRRRAARCTRGWRPAPTRPGVPRRCRRRPSSRTCRRPLRARPSLDPHPPAGAQALVGGVGEHERGAAVGEGRLGRRAVSRSR